MCTMRSIISRLTILSELLRIQNCHGELLYYVFHYYVPSCAIPGAGNLN